jgi:hypothetical protein
VDDTRAPWERFDDETALAYMAFRRWRDLGPTRPPLRRCRAIERRWSGRWRWLERVTAWDDTCWRVADDAALDALRRPEPL